MTIKSCDKLNCSNEFDIDNDEGIIITKIEGNNITTKYYCCPEHKESL